MADSGKGLFVPARQPMKPAVFLDLFKIFILSFTGLEHILA
jgi:hypothetical protein